MSRIQDILARAERDGTTRRLQPQGPSPRPPVARTATAISGTAALGPAPVAPPPPSVEAAEPFARTPPPALESVETRTAVPTLHPSLVAALAPHSSVAEQYRTIRSRVTLVEEQAPLRTLMVTSPGPAEGKSITAANLALTMAQEYQRTVVLVDADLRAPRAHALLGIGATPGLADVLAGTASLEEALVYLPDIRLAVLPGGTVPQFPTELLGSAAMRRVADVLRGRFDRVVFDLPAVTPLADVGTLAPLADGVVMVIRAGVTQRPALDDALAVLAEDKVVGVVLNDVN